MKWDSSTHHLKESPKTTVVFLNSGTALIAERERESKLYCSYSPIWQSRRCLYLNDRGAQICTFEVKKTQRKWKKTAWIYVGPESAELKFTVVAVQQRSPLSHRSSHQIGPLNDTPFSFSLSSQLLPEECDKGLLYPLLQNSMLEKKTPNSRKTHTYHRKLVKHWSGMWSVALFYTWKTNTTSWNITVHKRNQELMRGATFAFSNLSDTLFY